MSVHISSRVWSDAETTTASQLLVMLSLAQYGDDACYCWPGQERLAKECRITTRSVRYAIDDLCKGYQLWRGRRGSPPASNAYVVLVRITRNELKQAIVKASAAGCNPEDLEKYLSFMVACDVDVFDAATYMKSIDPPLNEEKISSCLGSEDPECEEESTKTGSPLPLNEEAHVLSMRKPTSSDPLLIRNRSVTPSSPTAKEAINISQLLQSTITEYDYELGSGKEAKPSEFSEYIRQTFGVKLTAAQNRTLNLTYTERLPDGNLTHACPNALWNSTNAMYRQFVKEQIAFAQERYRDKTPAVRRTIAFNLVTAYKSATGHGWLQYKAKYLKSTVVDETPIPEMPDADLPDLDDSALDRYERVAL